jgi:hypothetical protein
MVNLPATDDVFFASLRGEDQLGAVVRAHIHIEARLNQLLEALTPHPKHLPNLRDEQRLRLAVALGLNENILAPLKILGDIRNTFGHRLDVTLTSEMVDRLFNAFTPEDQKIILKAFADTHSQLGADGTSTMERADVRVQFIMVAVALDKYLILAEREARNARVSA